MVVFEYGYRSLFFERKILSDSESWYRSDLDLGLLYRGIVRFIREYVVGRCCWY